MNHLTRPDRRRPALEAVRYLWTVSTSLAMAIAESEHPRAADLVDQHNRACNLLRTADLDVPYRITANLNGVRGGDWDELVREIVHNRRQLSALRGAVAALLASINDAGGWDVADRAHALRVGRAMEATEMAMQAAMAQVDELT